MWSIFKVTKIEQAIRGSRSDIKPPIPDDDEVRNVNSGISTLYQVCTDTGDLVLTKIGNSPFKQEKLDSGDCFIVDSGSKNTIFVWKGNYFYFDIFENNTWKFN